MRSIMSVFILFSFTACQSFCFDDKPKMKPNNTQRVVVYTEGEDFEQTWLKMSNNCQGGLPRIINEQRVEMGNTVKIWIYYSCER
jgi:hypothetical protein